MSICRVQAETTQTIALSSSFATAAVHLHIHFILAKHYFDANVCRASAVCLSGWQRLTKQLDAHFRRFASIKCARIKCDIIKQKILSTSKKWHRPVRVCVSMLRPKNRSKCDELHYNKQMSHMWIVWLVWSRQYAKRNDMYSCMYANCKHVARIHSYCQVDGRLHALASTQVTGGTSWRNFLCFIFCSFSIDAGVHSNGIIGWQNINFGI